MNQLKNQHDFDDYVQTQTQTEKLLFDMYLKLEVRSPKPTFIHKFNSQPDPFISYTKNKNINFISDIENNILAFDGGYTKSRTAIIDANITTLLAAIILFFMGSGPVKGFAVTLGVGIFTTLFSVYFIARLFTSLYVIRNKNKEKLI